MTRSVTIYGFGSTFSGSRAAKTVAHDVDLLIVHTGTDAASCQFAISCKRRLADFIARAHITILSDGEERHCQFIKMSRAVSVGAIHDAHIERGLQAICAAIPSQEGS